MYNNSTQAPSGIWKTVATERIYTIIWKLGCFWLLYCSNKSISKLRMLHLICLCVVYGPFLLLLGGAAPYSGFCMIFWGFHAGVISSMQRNSIWISTKALKKHLISLWYRNWLRVWQNDPGLVVAKCSTNRRISGVTRNGRSIAAIIPNHTHASSNIFWFSSVVGLQSHAFYISFLCLPFDSIGVVRSHALLFFPCSPPWRALCLLNVCVRELSWVEWRCVTKSLKPQKRHRPTDRHLITRRTH